MVFLENMYFLDGFHNNVKRINIFKYKIIYNQTSIHRFNSFLKVVCKAKLFSP